MHTHTRTHTRTHACTHARTHTAPGRVPPSPPSLSPYLSTSTTSAHPITVPSSSLPPPPCREAQGGARELGDCGRVWVREGYWCISLSPTHTHTMRLTWRGAGVGRLWTRAHTPFYTPHAPSPSPSLYPSLSLPRARATTHLHIHTGRSRGFGFVTYATKAAAQRALAETNGRELHDRRLKVNPAKCDLSSSLPLSLPLQALRGRYLGRERERQTDR